MSYSALYRIRKGTNGDSIQFSSLVLSGFGFTQLEVYLLQIPSGALELHGTITRRLRRDKVLDKTTKECNM